VSPPRLVRLVQRQAERAKRPRAPGRRGARPRAPGRRGARPRAPGRRGARPWAPGRRGARAPGRRGARPRAPGRRGRSASGPRPSRALGLGPPAVEALGLGPPAVEALGLGPPAVEALGLGPPAVEALGLGPPAVWKGALRLEGYLPGQGRALERRSYLWASSPYLPPGMGTPRPSKWLGRNKLRTREAKKKGASQGALGITAVWPVFAGYPGFWGYR
jgi:hypothetical protein